MSLSQIRYAPNPVAANSKICVTMAARSVRTLIPGDLITLGMQVFEQEIGQINVLKRAKHNQLNGAKHVLIESPDHPEKKGGPDQ